MSTGYKNFEKGVGLVPNSTTQNTTVGDIEVLPDNRLHFFGVSNDSVTTDAVTATLTNKTLTSPVINTATADTITGITGAAFTLKSATSQNLVLNTQGTNILAQVSGTTVATVSSSGIRLASAGTFIFTNNSQAVTLTASSSASATYTITFPSAAPASNTVLLYDGTNYTWTGVLDNPMTTLGDIIYGGASGSATRLAGNITTTTKVLTQTGNGTISAVPSWTPLPGSISARYVGCTTTVGTSPTTITYTTQDYDTNSAYSSGTYTIPVPGKYLITAKLDSGTQTASTTQIANQLAILKNGTIQDQTFITGNGSTINYFNQITSQLNCSQNDTITVQANFNQSTPPAISNPQNVFTIIYLGS